ncbi:5634_t:CDS:2 [Ambispora leptoticha]|uniref:5634_t:CDS:1 n=1 Tax=Ambispora leptoticha TaxID=144679 RepID=A0A9N8WS88_9GLOM|nr:5634_t:CDS:2 [Ambispora leptoticha]
MAENENRSDINIVNYPLNIHDYNSLSSTNSIATKGDIGPTLSVESSSLIEREVLYPRKLERPPIDKKEKGFCCREGCNNEVYRRKKFFESYCSRDCYWEEVNQLERTQITILDENDLAYIRVARRFNKRLKSSKKIKAILRLQMPHHLAQKHLEYKKNLAIEKNCDVKDVTYRMYHGTKIAHRNHVGLGNIDTLHAFCTESTCGMCGITFYGNRISYSNFVHLGKLMWFANDPKTSSYYCGYSEPINAMFVVDIAASEFLPIITVNKDEFVNSNMYHQYPQQQQRQQPAYSPKGNPQLPTPPPSGPNTTQPNNNLPDPRRLSTNSIQSDSSINYFNRKSPTFTYSLPPSPTSPNYSMSCIEPNCQNNKYMDMQGKIYNYCGGIVCATTGRSASTPFTPNQNAFQNGQRIPKCKKPGCNFRRRINPNGYLEDTCGSPNCLAKPNIHQIPTILLPNGIATLTNPINPPMVPASAIIGPIDSGRKCSNPTCDKSAFVDPKNPNHFQAFCTNRCFWLEVSTLTKTKLTTMPKDDMDYARIAKNVLIGFPSINIKGILRLQMSKSIAHAHLELRKAMASSVNVDPARITYRVYHGTNVKCGPLGIIHGGSLCNNQACGVCGIAREGNKSSKSKHDGSMFFTNNPQIAYQCAGQGKTKAIFVTDVLSIDPNFKSNYAVNTNEYRYPNNIRLRASELSVRMMDLLFIAEETQLGDFDKIEQPD